MAKIKYTFAVVPLAFFDRSRVQPSEPVPVERGGEQG